MSVTRVGGKLVLVKQCYIKRKQYRCAIINCLLVQKYISGHTIQHPVSQIKGLLFTADPSSTSFKII